MIHRLFKEEKGIALMLALMMTVVILAMSAGVLYFITRSTGISGTAKVYNTVSEAADGSINVIKDAINLRMRGGDLPSVLTEKNTINPCFDKSIVSGGDSCTMLLALPSAVGSAFKVEVSVERLYETPLPGGRLEFARSSGSGGFSNVGLYYRIIATATGPGNVKAEKSILYRLST